MAEDYTTDASLEEAGYASGWDVWGVIKDCYGDVLADDELAEGQLESLKRAILAGAGNSDRSEPGAPGRHEDSRGVIQDLLVQPLNAVTEIFTRKGAIRGNHAHDRTTQWTYVVSGRLRIVTRTPDGIRGDVALGPRERACEEPGVAHAWEALEDTVVLVFTRGPRSGPAYETDTRHLTGDEKLL
jgi:quercetin dioxygenase-like cupin family protein